jgi:enoyl-CoA hydratase/carnithine racemase
MFAIKRLSQSFSQNNFVYNKIIHQITGKVGVVYLNSPSDLNALSSQLKDEIIHCLDEYQKNPSVRVITFLSKV